MYKKLTVLVALFILFSVAGRAYGADGDELTTTSFRVNSDGQMLYKSKVKIISTNETATAADSGTTYLVDRAVTGAVTLTLPSVATGLTYRVVSVKSGGTTGGITTGTIIVDPNIADTFVGCVNSVATTTFAAGDSIYSASATGDSVTIVGATTDTTALAWVCVDRQGTWTDGGTLK